tara:strand:- start:8517 stop:8828 length:312 start_codon:yes stop_codon:yes gene_type:complete
MSQKEKVKRHLNAGLKLTSWQAITEWHITRLAAIIHTLRDEGMDIVTENKKNPDTGKKYAVYTCNNPSGSESKKQYGLFKSDAIKKPEVKSPYEYERGGYNAG